MAPAILESKSTDFRSTLGAFTAALFLCLSISSTAYSRVALIEPIADFHDFARLSQALSDKAVTMACGRYTPVPNTIVCLTPTQNQMNRAFLRGSIWAEGLYGTSFHSVVYLDSPMVAMAQERIRGHDLSGKDLFAFFSAAEKFCESNRNACLNEEETELRDVLRSNAQSDSVVIGLPVKTSNSSSRGNFYLPNILSHELLHARFFNVQGYAQSVREFWLQKVSAQDQVEIATELRKTYNVDANEASPLLLNEFQAYLLQKGAGDSRLKKFLPKYQRALLENLKSL
jgi:hypothetical protein